MKKEVRYPKMSEAAKGNKNALRYGNIPNTYGGVYCLVKDKTIYIGQTKNFRERYRAYARKAKTGSCRPYIYDWKTKENPEFKILERVDDSKERRLREGHYIRLYKKLGYNVLNQDVSCVEVYQYDKNGLVAVYDSMQLAGEKNGFSVASIYNCINLKKKKRNVYKGFVWADHELTQDEVLYLYENKVY